jgi:hypothetical protein
VEKAIAAAAKKEIINFASRVTGVEIQNLLDILVEKPTAEMLNSEFSREGTVKSLVTFNNVADRLEKEMFLTGDGTFDTQRYTVIHNAMVLARLALLDENGLNTIAGKELYGEKSNIIFRFASSIDGNHQWLPKSPPYPRKTGIPICGDSNGYPTGFPLWNGTENRKIFMSIFKGPLSPALETPTDLGLEPALPEAYPYKPTAKNPYPNWTTVDDNNNCVDRSRR